MVVDIVSHIVILVLIGIIKLDLTKFVTIIKCRAPMDTSNCAEWATMLK